jgi:hypothetical protein
MPPLPATVQPVTVIVPTEVPELSAKLMVEAVAEKEAAVDRLPVPETLQPEIDRTTVLLLDCVKVMLALSPDDAKVVMPTASPKVVLMVTTYGTWLQLAVPVHCPPEQGYEPMGQVFVGGASHWWSVVLYAPPAVQDGACSQ